MTGIPPALRTAISRPHSDATKAKMRASLLAVRGVRWTPDMIAAYRAGKAAGLSHTALSEKIGVHENTLRRAIKRGVFGVTSTQSAPGGSWHKENPAL